MGFPISSTGTFPVRWDSMFGSGEGDVECDEATSLITEDAKRIARIIKQPLKTPPRNTQIFERPLFWSFMTMPPGGGAISFDRFTVLDQIWRYIDFLHRSSDQLL